MVYVASTAGVDFFVLSIRACAKNQKNRRYTITQTLSGQIVAVNPKDRNSHLPLS